MRAYGINVRYDRASERDEREDAEDLRARLAPARLTMTLHRIERRKVRQALRQGEEDI